MKVKLYKLVFAIAFFVVFFISSYFMDRGLITESADGFMYQLNSVRQGQELGSLGVIHTLRYYMLSHFFVFNNNIYEIIIFYIYVLIMLYKDEGYIKGMYVLFLFLSLFFSYRSVLVMISIYILITHIYFNKRHWIVIIISAFLSLLSTGSFLIYCLFLFLYKNQIVKSKKNNRYLNFLFVLLITIISGSLVHKILFFIDPVQFGSASAVSVDAFVSNFDTYSILLVLIDNLFVRSILYEAVFDNNGRLLLIIILFFISLINFILIKNRLTKQVFCFYMISMFFEGLMLYSFIPLIIVIFYVYLYRQVLFISPSIYVKHRFH